MQEVPGSNPGGPTKRFTIPNVLSHVGGAGAAFQHQRTSLFRRLRSAASRLRYGGTVCAKLSWTSGRESTASNNNVFGASIQATTPLSDSGTNNYVIEQNGTFINNTQAVSCAAGVSASTGRSVNGILTHC